MKKRRCNTCSTDMVKKYDEDGLNYFCERCAEFSSFTMTDETAYCQTCNEPLEEKIACGSIDLFCQKCNELKSKQAVIWKLNEKK